VDKRVEELLVRAVSALETMAADDMEIRVETHPPVCPHCETMNPKVRVSETEDSGPLAEFFTQAHCLSCNRVFYAIPMQTVCVGTVDEAREVLAEKARITGHERTNGQ
jgi:hypothetical protein